MFLRFNTIIPIQIQTLRLLNPKPAVIVATHQLSGAMRADSWPPEMVTLQIADPFGTQQRCVLGVLDAFSHRGRTQALDETEQVAEKNPGLRPAREIPNQRAIDLDDVDRQHLKMPQRGMAGTKIVKRNAAPRMTQSIDKARRFCDVTQCCGLRDL